MTMTMYRRSIHEHINAICKEKGLKIDGPDNAFYARLLANASDLEDLTWNSTAAIRKGRSCSPSCWDMWPRLTMHAQRHSAIVTR